MADIVKIDGIAVANFSKVNGIAKASLSKVLGQTMPSAAYTSANSVFFDGSNDYGKITGLNFPTTVGSVSFWFKMSDRYTSNQRIFSWHDDDAGGSYDDYYIVNAKDMKVQNTDLEGINDTMKTGKIKQLFSKSMKGRITSRVLLNKFIEKVA